MILNSNPVEPPQRPGRKRRKDRILPKPAPKKAAAGNPHGSLEERFQWMRYRQQLRRGSK